MGNLSMQLLTTAPDQACVGRILYQCMLEREGSVWRLSALKDQLCRHQLPENVFELCVGDL